MTSHQVFTYMGAISVPCCNPVPVENQKELDKLNWLIRYSGSSIHGNGLVHSLADSLPIMNNDRETNTYDTAILSQVSIAKGSANEKKFGGAAVGFWNRILIPGNKINQNELELEAIQGFKIIKKVYI